jgi:hypothetical protein
VGQEGGEEKKSGPRRGEEGLVLWCMLCVLHMISFVWKAAHAVVCKVVVPRVQSRLVSVARYWTCRCLRQERGRVGAGTQRGVAAELHWASG